MRVVLMIAANAYMIARRALYSPRATRKKIPGNGACLIFNVIAKPEGDRLGINVVFEVTLQPSAMKGAGIFHRKADILLCHK